ncbi:cilia- and flagella-associated protein 99 isoform X1 [Gadus morhua]|uniref:cilia- and flagella-associated protein 99 isoform X1 n=2 Tax=Gadus morhua TaxID=8049 RepID=UPI0011B6D0F1|nr:cilia- and flagella-associated protein 99 isoform X1 [Gadus morhua]
MILLIRECSVCSHDIDAGSNTMASNCGLLVKQAIMLLDNFDPRKQCLDYFIEDATNAMENINDLDKTFILDIFSGCMEFKKLLDVVVKRFYDQHGHCLRRGDRSQYVVICYLATFCLDDLGLKRFGNIVKSLDFKKIQKLVSFFLNVTNLTTWIQGEWIQIYDASHVETNWITPLLRWCPEIDVLMEKLSVEMSCKGQAKGASARTTVPQEFCLTQPKPRALPMPEPIPQQEKHPPVPNSTYRAPNEVTETNNYPMKLNNTAILRRAALYNHKVEQELKRLERLVEGQHEPSSFLRWQKEMQHRDLQGQQAQLECRRLEGRISHTKGATARGHLMERNQRTAQLQKEESTQLLQKQAEKRLREETETRELRQAVSDGHKNSKAAMARLQEKKQDIVKEVSQQKQELLRQAMEQEQEELFRQFNLIQETRAIESVRPIRHKFVDETETAGHGLLGEMSPAELRARLSLQREAEGRERGQRRERILGEKRDKEQLLQEHLEAIDLHSKALAQATALRKEEKKEKMSRQSALQQTVLEDERVRALQKVLQEKQKERQRLRPSAGVRPKVTEGASNVKNSQYQQEKPEEERWAELERSLERQLQKMHIK